MAPKKKAKTAAPPLACFAGAKITVIGANPFQRKLWEAKIGAGAAFLKPSQAASLKEGNDFVVIAAENVDPATVRAKAGAAQLVGDRWLTDSIARNERQNAAAHAWGAVEERPEEAAPARRSDAVWKSKFYGTSDVLPKFGCQRKITKADDQNKQLTGWLKQQLEWWQNGCIEGDASQHTAVGLTYKVIALIRSWPTKITPENWEDQRMLLAKQHFMSGRSSSANGGWLAYLEQLVTGGLPALQRVDAFTFWEKDPVRVAVKEITEMHMGITKKQMEALARKHGVRGARDLVDRRRELPISDVLRRKLELAPCGSDAYPNSHIPMDVQETKQIHGILESAARFIGLHMTVVGSWRRGKVGGHDVDVIIHAPLDGPLIDARAYAFESPTGLGNELMARFFKAVDQFGPPGFLHPHRSSGGEIFGNAGGRLPKLNTKHAFCLSPKVQGAVRRLDIILAPTDIYAHAVIGWSGSTGFQRSLAEYAKKAHEGDWKHVPDQKPIVGRAGWELSPTGEKVRRVEGRELGPGEHWAWGKHGIYIAEGSRHDERTDVYVEDNASLRTEKDVFEFFHLEYLEPREREC